MGAFSLQAFLNTLERQDLVLGLFLLGAGLVFLLLGLRVFKAVVMISFGVIGFVLGASLPGPEALQLVCALLGAVGLALASTLRLRVSVAVLAGAWSGVMVMGLLQRFGVDDSLTLVFGIVALVVTVSLSLILYQEVIAYVTSLEGAILFLSGLIVFLSQSRSVWGHIRGLLTDNLVFAPFLMIAGTVTGFYFQLGELRQKHTGVSV